MAINIKLTVKIHKIDTEANRVRRLENLKFNNLPERTPCLKKNEKITVLRSFMCEQATIGRRYRETLSKTAILNLEQKGVSVSNLRTNARETEAK